MFYIIQQKNAIDYWMSDILNLSLTTGKKKEIKNAKKRHLKYRKNKVKTYGDFIDDLPTTPSSNDEND